MSNYDRLIFTMMFHFLVKLLFSVLYTVASRKDDELFKTYKSLSAKLEDWHTPVAEVNQ